MAMKAVCKNRLLHLILAVLLFGCVITVLNLYELHCMKFDHQIRHEEQRKLPVLEAMNMDRVHHSKDKNDKPVVWIQGGNKSKDKQGRSGYLKHVYLVFETIGFRVGNQQSEWVVMWSHDYPFSTFSNVMKTLKPYQRVNHFPGSGYITNKVSLAQSNLDFIPKAFEMPLKKKEFLEYSEQHKNISWVQKSSQHRGIRVKDRHSLDLSKQNSFIQRFISNPLLIDGHKFDIGIYTVITGIDPLRVYVVEGDALFRFCPEVYYPFDDSILDKYVVGDDYLPMWDVPSLKNTLSEKDFTFRDSFKEYLRRQGKDSESIWNKMKSAIRQTVLAKEGDLIRSAKKFPSKRNFFEMIRFDFVIDENFNVFLMEGNMSPNLSSQHFKRNARLYNHVIFNALGLVGIHLFISDAHKKNISLHENSILVSSSDIRVFPDYCENAICKNSCKTLLCKLCKHCLSKNLEIDIRLSYLEHMNRGSSRRVFPPAMTQASALSWHPDSNWFDGLNENNKLIFLWFIGKCRLDPGWCH